MDAVQDLETWQLLMFFCIFYIIGFLHGRFPQENRKDIKRIRKTTNEMYWKYLQDINDKDK